MTMFFKGGVGLRVGYSVLREIHKKHFTPNAEDYYLAKGQHRDVEAETTTG